MKTKTITITEYSACIFPKPRIKWTSKGFYKILPLQNYYPYTFYIDLPQLKGQSLERIFNFIVNIALSSLTWNLKTGKISIEHSGDCDINISYQCLNLSYQSIYKYLKMLENVKLLTMRNIDNKIANLRLNLTEINKVLLIKPIDKQSFEVINIHSIH